MGGSARVRPLQKKLFQIRFGPGATILPPEVKRIHLDFAEKINGGHAGPRKLWRLCLPRLKYHNPSVSMTVNRTKDQASPATMTVFFEQTNLPRTDKIETIDMKHKRDTEILSQLIEMTGAREIEPTQDERTHMQKLEEEIAQAEKDRERERRRVEEIKREEALLQ